MLIKTIKVGSLLTNCYLVASSDKQCLIVDPGDQPERIIKVIEKEGLKPIFIVNTHAHPDHLEGDPGLKEHFSVPILMGTGDAAFLKLMFGFFGVPFFVADKYLEDKEKLRCGNLEAEVIATPGHSPEGICLYFKREKVLISGDTLFAGDVGRSDLPGGSEEALTISVKEKLLVLPDEVVVYPGHGPTTTIKKEKELWGLS
ncbi:MAG: MBL fold metallo-hydrolase [Candidatus Saganbacteria bacterium]|nr:MBL fold metallo-hydrolase [Candidatus Saganbacteria bacterium]